LVRERTERKPTVWTSAQWLDHFDANADLRRPIPWDQGAGLTEQERLTVGRSLQAWQRGESSDGRHLRAVADRHAELTADPAFRDVIERFIREEQRHGDLMGRFLDLAGLGRLDADWGDRVFRSMRHGSRDMAAWGTPVIVAEVFALIYFDALRKATGSPVLRLICAQILGDETPHIRFQCERFAILFRGRPVYRRLSLLFQAALFFAAVFAVWAGHRRVLRAGGYGWGRFWSASWRAMGRAWSLMQPGRYRWPAR
ncbi:MAG: ferritin-like domain-containing protein, partial [Gemmataceae bacterium]